MTVIDITRRLELTDLAADPNDPDLLQELLYGTDALVRVHLWRETGMPLEPPEARSKADV